MFENWAASDGVRGHLVAETAPSAADCANRDAYAEMANDNSAIRTELRILNVYKATNAIRFMFWKTRVASLVYI